MKDITKIVNCFQDSGLFLKGFTQTIENKQKNKAADFVDVIR